MYFFIRNGNEVFAPPATITWSMRREDNHVFYDFTFTNWLPLNGSYDNIVIAIGLPKTTVGVTALDTQFSPEGLTATYSYDTGMFALTNDANLLIPIPYYFESVSRNGTVSALNPDLPAGDHWYSLYYLRIFDISASTDRLYVTLRVDYDRIIENFDDSQGNQFEGDAQVGGTPSYKSAIDSVTNFFLFFNSVLDNNYIGAVMGLVASVTVLGVVFKLVI